MKAIRLKIAAGAFALWRWYRITVGVHHGTPKVQHQLVGFGV